MKNMLTAVLCGLTAYCMGQSTYENRVFIGLSAYGSQPIFNFYKKGYYPGLGGSVSVLSPKITLSDSNALWLRFGASINSSSQGSKTHVTSLGNALIENHYLGFNVLARLSQEKHERWRPFAEIAGNWNVFDSHFRPDYQQALHTRNFYNAYLPSITLSAGYMFRITDGFLLEAKLSYLQAFETINFAKVGQLEPTTNLSPVVATATPSMLMLHLGILFRLPPLGSYGNDRDYDDDRPYSRPPQSQPPSQPQTPQRDIPRSNPPKKEGKPTYSPF